MSGVNKVILVGNLGDDPQIKEFNDGGKICNLSLATSEKWKDKNTGEQKEATEWHRVVLSNRTADLAQKYLHKGSKVYIEGKLQTRKWQDDKGQDRYTTEVRGFQLQFLDSKGGSSYEPEHQKAKADGYQPQAKGPDDTGFEDDIPF